MTGTSTLALDTGADGKARCRWATAAPELVAYHDTEWGRAVHGESALYERVCLEGFQAGLSWLTILRKRTALRTAFAGFEPERVAAFGAPEVERLLRTDSIVRNRAKIEATIGNARALMAMHRQGDALADLVWCDREPDRAPPRHAHDVPAQTEGSRRLSRDLRGRGFRFVGPVTCYAALQAVGVVNDHLAGCHVRAECG